VRRTAVASEATEVEANRKQLPLLANEAKS
jgi:hypothetical protein